MAPARPARAIVSAGSTAASVAFHRTVPEKAAVPAPDMKACCGMALTSKCLAQNDKFMAQYDKFMAQKNKIRTCGSYILGWRWSSFVPNAGCDVRNLPSLEKGLRSC